MTPKQFVYWLQGFAELGDERPTEAQWVSIKNHLQSVFEEMALYRASAWQCTRWKKTSLLAARKSHL